MADAECPYCDLAVKTGELFCSRHSRNMRDLNSGIFLIKQKRMEECDWHITRLSLNFNFDGPQLYSIGTRQYVVTPDRFLLINEGQSFKTSVDSDRQNRMLTIAFKVGLAAEIYEAMSGPEKAVDDPFASFSSCSFFEGNYSLTPEINTRVIGLMQPVADAEQVQAKLEALLEIIVADQFQLAQDALLIDKVKRSTRIEIFRRLKWSMDYLRANYSSPGIRVEDLAREACLSIYHFKRLFSQFYGEAPYQYIKRLRLEKASQLLVTGMPVKSVCKEVGWHDPSSFVRLFKRENSLSPRKYSDRQKG